MSAAMALCEHYKSLYISQHPLCETQRRGPDYFSHFDTERSYKRQGHTPLKHFVGFPVQWWKARITVA